MSKRSNKRAKKLNQDHIMEALVSLDEQSKVQQLHDDDLFTITGPGTSAVSSNQLRKKELTDLLFNKPQITSNYVPGQKFPKSKSTLKNTSTTRMRSNRKFKRLVQDDVDITREQLQELKSNGIVKFSSNSGVVINNYVGDDDDGDFNCDEVDFLYMRSAISNDVLQRPSYPNAPSYKQLLEPVSDNDDDDAKEEHPEDECDEDDEDDEDDEEVIDDDSDREFMADWKKYTGGLTKPMKSLREQHKVRFAQLKEHDAYLQRRQEKEDNMISNVKLTPEALAKSILTGRHVDHFDLDIDETQDLWDDGVIQQQAEVKSKFAKSLANNGRDDDFDMYENMDYLVSMAKGAMKNKRSDKTSKHVTTKAFRVAPSGLSINPVKEDMDALVSTYQRKVKNQQRVQSKIRHVLDNDGIKVKYVPDVSAKEKARFAKTIYKPIPDGHDVHKQKTRQERNAEKKKAQNRYQHMLEKRERALAKEIKAAHTYVDDAKKHEKFIKEKLPQIRAEVAEVKKDQPVKFGRNYYQPLKPDLQTEKTLTESQGHLRRTTMSTSLLADSFNQLQRTNKIEAIGSKHGKRPTKTQYKLKEAMAPGVRVEKVDVQAIMKKAKERAQTNPKVIQPTKNKKRKFQDMQAGNTSGDHYDYGYDSDDDIWA